MLSWLVVWFAMVFLPALAFTVALRACFRRGTAWAAAVGLGIAAFFVLLAGLLGGLSGRSYTFDHEYIPSDRAVTGFIVGGSLVFWLVGVGAGAAVSLGVVAGRRVDA